MNTRAVGGLTTIAAVTGGAYWTAMSPYSQLQGWFPYRADNGERVVALTFDDGPNEPYTSQLVEVLDSRGVSATFFQVGQCVERHPEVTPRLVAAGHLVGNHSYSHVARRCVHPGALRDEVSRAQSVISHRAGQIPALYRPPWLLRTPALFRLLREQRLQPVSGEFCHSLEVAQPSPERIARAALAKARPGAILIFHDGYGSRRANRASTVEAVRLVVDQLLDRGYAFTTIDHLLGIPAYHPLA